MSARSYQQCGALVMLATMAAVIGYPYLPEQIPLQWNLRGEVADHGPRWMIFLIGPGLMTLTILAFAVLPWLSPRRFEVERFLRSYQHLLLIFVGANGYLFAVILVGLTRGHPVLDRAVIGGVALTFALLGNLMGRVRRNFFLGIRTPWTLASERVWNATHRVAARAMVSSGLLGMLAAGAGLPLTLVMALLVASIAYPAAYSLWYYKQLERSGRLDSSG